MLKASIQFVRRKDGVTLAYSTFGKGQPLVFPPPWVTSLSFFLEDSVARQFWDHLAQVFTVIIYDKHGCGQSDRDRKEYTLKSELLDLEIITDHLGLRDFILLGSSMAGPISIAYTARYPQRVTHLILYGAYSSGKNLATEEVESALVSLVKASWGLGSKALTDIFLPDANLEELHSVAKFQRTSCSPEVAASILRLCFAFDVTEFLSSISIPTLILHREGDKAISIQHGRQLASEIPNARFKVLKGKFQPPW
jgi:pimeloyl-ACP methyl ester carboxylesterase